MIENIPLEQKPNSDKMLIDIPSAQMPQNPMLVAVKYNLVVCLDLKDIIDVVNEAIKEGYFPVGGLIYAEGKYIQTIVSA